MSFMGKTIDYSYRIPDLETTSLSYYSGDVVVGDSLELTARQNSLSYIVDISEFVINISMARVGSFNDLWEFSGFLIQDIHGVLDPIIEVTLETSIVGIDSIDLGYDENSIFLNLGDVNYVLGDYVNLVVTFADTRPPSPEAPSVIVGGDDADSLPGTDRPDTITAGKGDDTVYAKNGNDTVEGGASNDAVYGGQGNDKLYGQADNDRVYGGLGNDKIYGEMGNDTLGGGQGQDDIWGGMGDDIIYGGDNDDVIEGGADNDTIFGGTGADLITGGAGDDELYGGAGPDRFVFAGNSGNDILYGLDFGDEIDLDGQSYETDINAEGHLVLTLSGGGSITLYGHTEVDQSWFV